jgi:hypothetical protein
MEFCKMLRAAALNLIINAIYFFSLWNKRIVYSEMNEMREYILLGET